MRALRLSERSRIGTAPPTMGYSRMDGAWARECTDVAEVLAVAGKRRPMTRKCDFFRQCGVHRSGVQLSRSPQTRISPPKLQVALGNSSTDRVLMQASVNRSQYRISHYDILAVQPGSTISHHDTLELLVYLGAWWVIRGQGRNVKAGATRPRSSPSCNAVSKQAGKGKLCKVPRKELFQMQTRLLVSVTLFCRSGACYARPRHFHNFPRQQGN